MRSAFADREMVYDAALVTLELSVLYLEQGHTADLGALAGEMTWIFDAKGIREALAALGLFCRGAHAQDASVDFTRKFVSYLERARRDQELRFADCR